MATRNAPPHLHARRLGALVVAFAAALAVWLLPLTAGLVGALVLAVITAPAHRWLGRLLPARPAALLVTLGVLLLLAGPGAWLAVTTVREAGDALRTLQASAAFAHFLARIRAAGLMEHLAGLGGWIPSRAAAIFGSATHATLNVVVALFGLYYLLTGGAALWQRAGRMLPFDAAITERLRARFVAVTEAMLLGTLLTAALQGTLVGAGFALVGLRAPVFWGVVTACTSVLPILGSALVWLPGVAVLALGHRYGAAALLFAIGFVLASNLDNVVRLVLYRRVSGIHPMLTLLGAFAGVRSFGVVGVLLGPLALSYFFELLAIYEESGVRIPALEPTENAPVGERAMVGAG